MTAQAHTAAPAHARNRLTGRARPGSGDRGLFSTELALVVLVALTVCLVGIQALLWFHARNVAQRAAQQGVVEARRIDFSPGHGAQTARKFVGRFSGTLRSPAITTEGSSGATVRIQVSGTVPVLVPGWELAVRQEAASPREHWSTP